MMDYRKVLLGCLKLYLRLHLPVFHLHQLAADCAEGLAYLASLNFVHRDVAARNVLVSSEWRAKICDFGFSRQIQDSGYFISEGGSIPVRWTAPEGYYCYYYY